MTTNYQQNQTPAKMGVRARERNALERIGDVEMSLASLTAAVRQSFANNDQNVSELVEVVSAIVRLVGAEQVAQTLTQIQTEKAEAQAGQDKADLQKQIDAGYLVATTVVTPASTVVGLERNEDGSVFPPGYVQLGFSSVKPEYQTKLLARGVGDTFDTENGRKFEITAIYEGAKVEKAAE